MGILATKVRLRRTVRTDDLTKRQAQVLTFILQCWANGYIPTLRAIGERFGIASPNGVMYHVRALTTKGYVKHEDRCGYQLTARALDLAL